MDIKLSIMICTLHERGLMLYSLVEKLKRQAEGKPIHVFWVGDLRNVSIGEKRNILNQIAKGKYTIQIDEDDDIHENFVDEFLIAAHSDCDVLCCERIRIDHQTKIQTHVFSGIEYDNIDDPIRNIAFRYPNQQTALKSEIAKQVLFPDSNFGEDTEYGLELKKRDLLKTQYKINKVLYYYNYDERISTTASHKLHSERLLNNGKPGTMDVVIVSNGTTMKKVTQDCIDSLKGHIAIVVEKDKEIQYAGADMIYQKEPFIYNQCLNDGAKAGDSEYICFSNNDIIFEDGFIRHAIYEMRKRALDVGGVKNGDSFLPSDVNITGYCFIMRRYAWNKIGMLSEDKDFNFFCADNIVFEQIKGLKYGILQNTSVNHKEKGSHALLTPSEHEDYTVGCIRKFNKKYKQNVCNLGI